MTTLSISPEWKLIDNEMQWRWRDLNKTSLSLQIRARVQVCRALNPNVRLTKTESECWSVWSHITISRLRLRHQFKVVRFVRLGPSEECESDVWGATTGRGWPPHVKYICLNVSVLHFYEAPLCVIPTDFSGILAVMELVIDIGM